MALIQISLCIVYWPVEYFVLLFWCILYFGSFHILVYFVFCRVLEMTQMALSQRSVARSLQFLLH